MATHPILAAIALARETDAALTVLLARLDEDDEEAVRVADEAADRSSDAINALAAVMPTTGAGLFALIQHYAEDAAFQEPHSVGAVCLAHLARVIAARPPPPS